MDKLAPPVLHSVNRRPTADSWYVLPPGSDGRTYQKSTIKSLKNRIDRKGLIRHHRQRNNTTYELPYTFRNTKSQLFADIVWKYPLTRKRCKEREDREGFIRRRTNKETNTKPVFRGFNTQGTKQSGRLRIQ